jgi:hypothetical protein
MFDTIETYITAPSAVQNLRTYVSDHRAALLNAAALIGGQYGVRLARAVVDGLDDDEVLSRRSLTALDDLLDLLMLENVDDLDSIVSAHFATIDPSNPVVEEICLLADGLSDVTAAYRRTLNAIIARKVAA